MSSLTTSKFVVGTDDRSDDSDVAASGPAAVADDEVSPDFIQALQFLVQLRGESRLTPSDSKYFRSFSRGDAEQPRPHSCSLKDLALDHIQ